MLGEDEKEIARDIRIFPWSRGQLYFKNRWFSLKHYSIGMTTEADRLKRINNFLTAAATNMGQPLISNV
jgi:hypothetical protein